MPAFYKKSLQLLFPLNGQNGIRPNRDSEAKESSSGTITSRIEYVFPGKDRYMHKIPLKKRNKEHDRGESMTRHLLNFFVLSYKTELVLEQISQPNKLIYSISKFTCANIIAIGRTEKLPAREGNASFSYTWGSPLKK